MSRARTLPVLATALPLMGAAPAGYVDAKLCATCHRQIANDYARTGMGGRSTSRPPRRFPARPATTTTIGRTQTTGMIERGSGWYQRRWQIAFGGKETDVEGLRIDYMMGSGNHAHAASHGARDAD